MKYWEGLLEFEIPLGNTASFLSTKFSWKILARLSECQQGNPVVKFSFSPYTGNLAAKCFFGIFQDFVVGYFCDCQWL